MLRFESMVMQKNVKSLPALWKSQPAQISETGCAAALPLLAVSLQSLPHSILVSQQKGVLPAIWGCRTCDYHGIDRLGRIESSTSGSSR
jgi:hypothetical protein